MAFEEGERDKTGGRLEGLIAGEFCSVSSLTAVERQTTWEVSLRSGKREEEVLEAHIL